MFAVFTSSKEKIKYKSIAKEKHDSMKKFR